ncbi:MAG: hypothetical protein K9G83_10235, partial [Hyphomonadaceae bacterium]|nr:hypothetical protein [Hyphomonadaceae bacterium]
MRQIVTTLISAVALAACASLEASTPSPRGSDLVEERSISDLQADLSAGRTTSEALVAAYLARISAMDRA